MYVSIAFRCCWSIRVFAAQLESLTSLTMAIELPSISDVRNQTSSMTFLYQLCDTFYKKLRNQEFNHWCNRSARAPIVI